jgi:hypothetical protein
MLDRIVPPLPTTGPIAAPFTGKENVPEIGELNCDQSFAGRHNV